MPDSEVYEAPPRHAATRCADAGEQGMKTRAIKVCGDDGVKV